MGDELDQRRRRLSQTGKGELPTTGERRRRVSVAGAEEVRQDGVFTSLEFDEVEERNLDVGGGYKVRWAGLTVPGADPGRVTKTNQDSFCVCESLLPGLSVFGVFDGHGFHGQKVSQYVGEHLPAALKESESCKKGDYEEAIRAVFGELNGQILEKPSIDCEMSGSTGIVACLKDKTLHVHNVGDSRAILGSLDPISGQVVAKSLNVEHKPTLPEEAERVVSKGGRIQPYMYRGEPVGPPRVWLADEDVPGLCMTRAFGDKLANTVGVTADPDTIVHKLATGDKYLVLCSDGITEFISDTELMNIVHGLSADKSAFGPHLVCKTLMKESRKRWQDEEEEVIDDCTLIVVFL